MSRPRVQALKGTITTDGKIKGTVEAEGACIMPDGKIYQGTDTLNDNPVTGNSVDYEIPMYDADGVDLSKVKCYTSA
ncbi:hypothetical protein EDD41_0798 [Luteococcus japonicus]|uniref:Uncharacterized protein n=1 Tax=Luteococcus japonicus TaxID=33984 RepID=A0A3N1ZRW4_9ACTN|nr:MULTISPECIES: hypothetical protein [Luteococcus]MDN5565062.1 hypothetical protein [Luteococcus sp.]ROR53634.1 hypothetical protein EDD41_0798 [Luteococcus japonicus]